MSNPKINITKECLEKFLRPINKISESCVLKIKKNELTTVCSSENNSIILLAKLKVDQNILDSDDEVKLNLIDIKRFLSGLSSLSKTGKFFIELFENHIKCKIQNEKNENEHIIYHLVDDSIIKQCRVNPEKINSLEFNTKFVIPKDKIRQILQATVYTKDTQKIYIHQDQETSKIYAELTDKNLQNVDSFETVFSEKSDGELIGYFPISIDVFKNLLTLKSDILVGVNNTNKILTFNFFDEEIELKFIVSSLIK